MMSATVASTYEDGKKAAVPNDLLGAATNAEEHDDNNDDVHPFSLVVANATLLVSIGLYASTSPQHILHVLPQTCKAANLGVLGLLDEFAGIEAAVTSSSSTSSSGGGTETSSDGDLGSSAFVQLVRLWWSPLGIGRFPMRLNHKTSVGNSEEQEASILKVLPCKNLGDVVKRMKMVLRRRSESLHDIRSDTKGILLWDFQRLSVAETPLSKKQKRALRMQEFMGTAPDPLEIPQYADHGSVRSQHWDLMNHDGPTYLYDAQHMALAKSFKVPMTANKPTSRDRWKVCSIVPLAKPLTLPIETYNVKSTYGEEYGQPYPLGRIGIDCGIRRSYGRFWNEVADIFRAFVPLKRFDESITEIKYVNWSNETRNWNVSGMCMFDPEGAWDKHIQVIFKRLVSIDSVTLFVALSPSSLRGEIWQQKKSREPRSRRKEDAKSIVFLAPDAGSWLLAEVGSQYEYPMTF